MTYLRFSSTLALFAAANLTACGASSTKTPDAAAQATTTQTPAVAIAPAHAITAPVTETVTGTVAETMVSGGYTYVRLQTDKGDVWFAASEFPVKVGERLTVPLEMPMQDFHSKTLNRDFPLIYFASQVAREGQPLSTPPGAAATMGSPQAVASAQVEPVAPAPGGLAIADVWSKRKSLAGKQVVVRGKVVKVNHAIMGRNWIHLQDGSGVAADGTNDLTVTTDADVKLGDIVTASGVLAIGKDFGAGYAYEAILEQASVAVK